MRSLDIVYFDMEAQPGHWIGGDYVSKLVTAVAWAHGDKDPLVLTHYDSSLEQMASALAWHLERADIVVGHYIRAFDLPLLNGALLRAGAQPLPRILTVDTKLDLLKAHGRSKSQENLGASLGLENPKVKLSLTDWEGFNTLDPRYKDEGIERVIGDVKQNRELHRKLVDLGWIGPPRAWEPKQKGKA
jgi:hypothetical protein